MSHGPSPSRAASHHDERSEEGSALVAEMHPAGDKSGSLAIARDDNLSRRDALKLAAFAPLAGIAANPQAERVQRFMASLAVAEESQQGYSPKFFSAKEWRTVLILADYVIPRDLKSGSATDAKAPEYMDFILHDENTSH